MAATDALSSGYVVAVSIPGDGMPRFCATLLDDLRTGDWVVVEGPLGDEPGEILFSAGDIDAHTNVEHGFTITRRLEDRVRAHIGAHVSEARSLTNDIASLLSEIDPELELRSVRVSLDGVTLFCTCGGRTAHHSSELEHILARTLKRPVRVESVDRPSVMYGSVGRIPDGAAGDEGLLLERVGIGRLAGNPRPNGWPRLGSRVQVGDVCGVLMRISVRHGTATVRLDDGDELDVPVANLDLPPS